ncbi:MAG: trypsin-like peptidase domain-containing protein [Candidatus Roizmanbacteria bacterium]|nr:trypsin-like peptidase domain-containing protein [Candidatus Roizmanbacteria bacterium]
MYCPECGKQNPEDGDFCQQCGTKIDKQNISTENIHTKHETTTDYLTSNTSPYPYVISISKLIVLSTVTLGLYDIYWFYKQWKSLKAERDLKVTPLARAFFSILTSYYLFREVSKAIKSIDKTRGLEAGTLATAYFILVLLYKLPEPYWWLSTLSVLPLIPIQNTINEYWRKKYHDKIVPSKFGTWNWVWTIIGGVFILLALYGSFGTDTTVKTTSSNTQNGSAFKTIDTSKNAQKSDYNQEEIASSVVNIFCPSTVKNEETSGGSGTIMTEEGIILTNSHIIPQDKNNLHVDEEGCIVVLPDPKTGQPKDIYLAHPIVIPGLSDKYDLAYVSIYAAYYDESDKKYAGEYPRKFPTFDDTARCTNENLKLGESVRIFGYPAISGGYSLTVTDGLVSSFPGDGLIVTSAKISHGNSGGLAVDKNGCMIGVPSLVSSDENESLGVIYSMNLVNKFSEEVSTYLNKK